MIPENDVTTPADGIDTAFAEQVIAAEASAVHGLIRLVHEPAFTEVVRMRKLQAKVIYAKNYVEAEKHHAGDETNDEPVDQFAQHDAHHLPEPKALDGKRRESRRNQKGGQGGQRHAHARGDVLGGEDRKYHHHRADAEEDEQPVGDVEVQSMTGILATVAALPWGPVKKS